MTERKLASDWPTRPVQPARVQLEQRHVKDPRSYFRRQGFARAGDPDNEQALGGRQAVIDGPLREGIAAFE